MKDRLDVLLIESRPGTAELGVAELTEAGHRVHRCYDAGARSFPCRGLTGEGCPLDDGVDVAFLARGHVMPRPTPLEHGVSCAIRAGVPIVEQGPDVLDPYSPWVVARVDRGDDVAAACEAAAAAAFDPLREAIRLRTARLLAGAGIDPVAVRCQIEADGPALVIRLDLPTAVSRGVEQALAVRVLDAVRTTPRTYGRIDVEVRDLGALDEA
jgi:hypothetical protein